MNVTRIFRAAWAAALLLAAVSIRAAEPVVRAIRVEAPSPAQVDAAYVRAMVSVREGGAYDPEQLMRDVRALERTGRFRRVDARAERAGGDVEVVFTVRPRLRIERLDIDGAEDVGNRKIREWINIGVGDLVDDAVLSGAARKVEEEYYKKYYPHARMTWTVDEDPARGTARVRIQVKEGTRGRVRRIEFTGNAHVDRDDLLAKMKQHRFRWYNPLHWFNGAGRLNEDDLNADLYTLRRVYTDRGYLDAKVEGPEIRDLGGSRLALRFKFTEGTVYRVGSITVDGLTAFPSNDVARLMRIRPGEIASLAAIDGASDAVMDYYGNRGYILTQVRHTIDSAAERNVADLRFKVREGTVSRIRDIKIRGNVVTKDKVIRRELVIQPGELYNRSRVQTSENRLRNLGYFSYVASTPEPTAEGGLHDLVFDVEEDRMGHAEAGVGFSSIDRIVGRFEIGHGNVDILNWPPIGGGQKLRLGVEAGTRRQDYTLSFVEPYFLDERLRLGVDLYSREARYYSSLYNVKRVGGLVNLERPIGRFHAASVGYGLENTDLFDIDETASTNIQAAAGSRLKSFVETSFSRDTRNRTRIPTAGNLSRATLTLAGGPFGGDVDYYKLEARSTQYFPLWFGHVLMLRGQAGTMDSYTDRDDIPFYDLFYLGGLNTVRAFKYRHIGPTDGNDEPIGGRSMAFGSAEYTVPIVSMVRAAAFVDGGMVWADPWTFDFEWNSGYGIGLRLDIPMMPLRIDYAWQLKWEDYNRDDNGRFNIMFGYPF